MFGHNRWLAAFLFLTTMVVVGCGGSGTGENEPNNTIDEAGQLPLGTTVQTTIQKKEDTDWFKVDLPSRGYLRVKADGVPDKIGLQVRFALKEEWEGNKVKPIRDWNNPPHSVRIPEKGTYYVQFKDDYGDDASDKSFDVTADFLEEFDSNEINDSPKQAVSVEPGDVSNPAIYPTGDRDWYKIDVPGKGYLTAGESDVPDGINPMIKWVRYDEWSDPKIQKMRGTNDLPDAVFVPEEGTYYVEVSEDYDDGQSTETFRLKLDYSEPRAPGEPNDGPDQATALKPGRDLKTAIFPKGDVDYFQFSPNKSGTLLLITEHVSGVTPEFRLHTVQQDEALKEQTDWNGPPLEYNVQSDEEYVLQVHDDYDDQRSPDPFTIRTKWKTGK